MPAFRLAVAFLLVLPASSAQKSAGPAPAPPPSGSVTGHVICSDTQGPARFATVALVRKQDASPAQPVTTKEKETAVKEPEVMLLAKGRTSLDGSFTVHDVPAGDYYAVATMPGYVLPVAPPKGGRNAPHDPDDAMVNFPVVHVVADRTAPVEVTIHRGSLISGRAHFDDGAPIIGMTVFARVVEGPDPFQQILSSAFEQISRAERYGRTDDEGRYRIPGLPPGKYNVEMHITAGIDVRMMGNSQDVRFGTTPAQQNLTIYAPNSFRQTAAKVIEIKSDEPHPDTDIQFDLGAMHSVSGTALAGEDRRPVSYARVYLEDGPDFRRETLLQPDGSFRFDYVPSGTYKLSVGAVDYKPGVVESRTQADILRAYEMQQIPVIVAEHDVKVDDIALTPKAGKGESN